MFHLIDRIFEAHECRTEEVLRVAEWFLVSLVDWQSDLCAAVEFRSSREFIRHFISREFAVGCERLRASLLARVVRYASLVRPFSLDFTIKILLASCRIGLNIKFRHYNLNFTLYFLNIFEKQLHVIWNNLYI